MIDFKKLISPCNGCGSRELDVTMVDTRVPCKEPRLVCKECRLERGAADHRRHPEPNITVKALRTSCLNGFEKEVDVVIALIAAFGEYRTSDYIVRVVEGGVTGWESFYVTRAMQHHEGDWTLCAGTELRYDRLVLPEASVRLMIDKLCMGLDLNEKEIVA